MSVQNDKIMTLGDGKVLYEDLRSRMAPVIHGELTGNPVVFNDGVPLEKIRSLKVSFAPKQSGSEDPSPTNIRPISGRTWMNINRTGKNVLPYPFYDGNGITRNGITFTVASNGVVEISGTATDVAYYNFSTRDNKMLLKAGTYTKTIPGNAKVQFNIYKGVNDPVSSGNNATFTLSEDTEVYCYLRVAEDASFDTAVKVYPQIEIGSTATAYAPYTGESHHIEFPVQGRNKYNPAEATQNKWINNTTGEIENANGYWISGYIPVKSGDAIRVTAKGSSRNAFFDTGKSNPVYVAYSGGVSDPITAPFDGYFIFSAQTSTIPYDGQIICTVNDSDISYEPYTNTVYGGSLDVLTGVLTVDKAMVDMGSLAWTYNTTYEFFVVNAIQDRKIGILNLWSDLFKTIAGSWSGTPLQNALWGNGSNKTLYVQIPPYDNVDDFMSLVDGHQLVYELETPITYQLDPAEIRAFDGTNVFFTDADSIVLDHAIDTKKYIDAAGSDLKGFNVNGINMIGQSGDVNLFTQPWSYGIGVNSSSGLMYIGGANSDALKAGTASYLPVTAAKQHESAFYALAKLAGVDLANETVTLGQYPANALVAIQKMLGIYEAPWELIREDIVTNQTKGNIVISTDMYGNSFELTDIRLRVYLPVQESEAKVEDYGRVKFVYGNDDSIQDTLYIGAWTQPAGTAKGANLWIEQKDGMIERHYSSNATSGSSPSVTFNNSFESNDVSHWQIGNKTYTKIIIEAITGVCHYVVYGKRKWN